MRHRIVLLIQFTNSKGGGREGASVLGLLEFNQYLNRSKRVQKVIVSDE